MIALIAKTVLAGVTVTLPTECKVRGTEIELGELAQVAGLDAELVERLRAFELGYAPAPGFSRLLTAERIRADLARELPGVDVRVIGERACRVWPAVEELTAAELEGAARAELTRLLAGKEATFTLSEPVQPVKVPLGDQGRRLSARTPEGELASGIVAVPVEVLVDGQRYRTVWTSWRLEVWETREVLARPVRAGEELRPELFERARVKRERVVDAKTLVPAQVLGAVAKRDLASGASVTDQDVHRPPAVSLGTTLFLRVKKGSIEARVAAVALETGAVGDRIRLKTVDAGQELVATIVGHDLCELKL